MPGRSFFSGALDLHGQLYPDRLVVTAVWLAPTKTLGQGLEASFPGWLQVIEFASGFLRTKEPVLGVSLVGCCGDHIEKHHRAGALVACHSRKEGFILGEVCVKHRLVLLH